MPCSLVWTRETLSRPPDSTEWLPGRSYQAGVTGYHVVVGAPCTPFEDITQSGTPQDHDSVLPIQDTSGSSYQWIPFRIHIYQWVFLRSRHAFRRADCTGSRHIPARLPWWQHRFNLHLPAAIKRGGASPPSGRSDTVAILAGQPASLLGTLILPPSPRRSTGRSDTVACPAGRPVPSLPPA